MDRVYVILNIREGKHSEAVQSLQANPGVRWVDALEGQWDISTAIEASNRPHLAQLLVRAISSVETITEDIQLLPTSNGPSAQSIVEPAKKSNNQKIRRL